MSFGQDCRPRTFFGSMPLTACCSGSSGCLPRTPSKEIERHPAGIATVAVIVLLSGFRPVKRTLVALMIDYEIARVNVGRERNLVLTAKNRGNARGNAPQAADSWRQLPTICGMAWAAAGFSTNVRIGTSVRALGPPERARFLAAPRVAVKGPRGSAASTASRGAARIKVSRASESGLAADAKGRSDRYRALPAGPSP